MRISQIVSHLNKVKTFNGDLEVYLSSDSEGNSYSDTGKKPEDCIYSDSKKVILYPFTEGLFLETE